MSFHNKQGVSNYNSREPLASFVVIIVRRIAFYNLSSYLIHGELLLWAFLKSDRYEVRRPRPDLAGVSIADLGTLARARINGSCGRLSVDDPR